VEERKDLDVQALAHGFALIKVDFQKGHIRVFCRYFEKLQAEKDGTLEREGIFSTSCHEKEKDSCPDHGTRSLRA
jgi:hypothetical protein